MLRHVHDPVAERVGLRVPVEVLQTREQAIFHGILEDLSGRWPSIWKGSSTATALAASPAGSPRAVRDRGKPAGSAREEPAGRAPARSPRGAHLSQNGYGIVLLFQLLVLLLLLLLLLLMLLGLIVDAAWRNPLGI